MKHQNQTIQTIIWDWNGTLLNDVQECYSIVRNLAQTHQLQDFTFDEYKSVFGFPISHYYEKLGFDFDKVSYKKLAAYFIKAYLSMQPKLHEGVMDTLIDCHLNYQQEVISAYNNQRLQKIILEFGLNPYFNSVMGIQDDFAASKAYLFKKRFEEIDPKTSLLVGDTMHDAEIAAQFGANCILISHGHQAHRRLLDNPMRYPVVSNLNELRTLLS